MPTGYTAKIADGIDFKTFALNCARAFGACADQRDNGDGPPKLTKPNTEYFLGIIREAEQFDYSEAAFYGAKERATSYRREYANSKIELHNKYEQMLSKVLKWKAPTKDHVPLREFMESQLRESIMFDCVPTVSMDDDPKTYGEWVLCMKESNAKRIKNACESIREEEARVARNNKWISDLYQSLH